MIVGRKKEIEALNARLYSNKSEFIAVYGRRRVGKTYLVDQVFRKEMVFRHTGLAPLPSSEEEEGGNEKRPSSKMKRQIDAFCMNLSRYGFALPRRKPKTWSEAFLLLEEHLNRFDSSKRLAVFIDEMPWMDTPASRFLDALTSFWNDYCALRGNIVLIACGSASSWILDKLIHSKGGLYGRITYQLHLGPFRLSECKLFLEANRFGWSDYEITEAYMALGGIPYYLDYLNPAMSVAQNLDALFFENNASLKNEFQDLFSSQFSSPERYQTLIEAIGSKNIGLTIEEITKVSSFEAGGTLSSMLSALLESGFVAQYTPFGSSARLKFYRVIDPFVWFYLKQIKPNQGNPAYCRDCFDTNKVQTWKGVSFELVCFNHIEEIKRSLGILGIAVIPSFFYEAGSENKEGAQIDLVLTRGDKAVNLIEAKFYADEYFMDKEEHVKLERRKRVIASYIPSTHSIRPVLVTTFGLSGGYRSDFSATLTLEDLFEAV